MGREVGGGIGMGKTCEPKAFSFQCMTEFTTNKNLKKKKKKKKIKIKPTKLKRAIMPLGFFKGGLEGKPAWHPWTMSPGICQGGSLGTK